MPERALNLAANLGPNRGQKKGPVVADRALEVLGEDA